jgi:hypothetical protein
MGRLGEHLMKARRITPEGASSMVSPPRSIGTPKRAVAAALHINRRTLQCALGVFWIFDGLLKFQPDLFKPSFLPDFISPMAAGQPQLIGSTISHTASFLARVDHVGGGLRPHRDRHRRGIAVSALREARARGVVRLGRRDLPLR